MSKRTCKQVAEELCVRASYRGFAIPLLDAAMILARAERTLHRWAEAECGDEYGRCIERDEKTGKPFRTYDRRDGTRGALAIPDHERGALKRVAAVCEAYGLHFYHQTDPRGCALYVSSEPLTAQNYPNGIAVC